MKKSVDHNLEKNLIQKTLSRILRDQFALPLGLALLNYDIRFLDLEEDIPLLRIDDFFYINRHSLFITKRNTEEALTFLLLHEISHVLFFHDRRQKGRDPELWTLATDYMVNGLLNELRDLFDPELVPYKPNLMFTGDEPAPYNPEFKNMLEEEIYHVLTASAKVDISVPKDLSIEEAVSREMGKNGFSGVPRFVRSRIRYKKKDIRQTRLEMQGLDFDGTGKSGKKLLDEHNDEKRGVHDKDAYGLSPVSPESDTDEDPEKAMESNLKLSRHLFREVLRGHGSVQTKGILNLLCGPTTDWETILRDSLRLALDRAAEIAWGRPRITWLTNPDTIPYLPGPADEFIPGTIVISIDESASLGNTDLAKIIAVIGEVKSRYKRIYLIKHDTNIRWQKEYEKIGTSELKELRIRRHFGGTSHRKVFSFIDDYARSRSDVPISVYLAITDLESDIPDCQGILPSWLPRIYLSTNRVVPEGLRGKVINIQ